MEKPITKTEIKTVKLEAGSSFIANGKTYKVSENLTIGRMQVLEELEDELFSSSNQKSNHDTMLAAMKAINDLRVGDAYTLMYNKIEQDQRTAKFKSALLRICAVFINTEGEDLSVLTEERIIEKISDWQEESLEASPFLLLAISCVKDFFNHYIKAILNILEEGQGIQAALKETLDIRNLTMREVNGPVIS